MECDTIRKVKKTYKNIKIQTSQDENSDLKKELKNKDTSECRKKNIRNMLQEDSDLTEESKNEDTHEIKSKDENIGNKMKTLQNDDNDMKKALKNKDTYEVKCKKKKIRNEIKASQEEDSDSTEKLKNEDTNEVKCKNENIWNKKKTLQDKDSYLKKELENNTHRDKGIKLLQNENKNAKEVLRNKNTRKAGSNEDVKEEDCSDATYLAQQMTSAERLGQAESKVIILKEIQFNKTCE